MGIFIELNENEMHTAISTGMNVWLASYKNPSVHCDYQNNDDKSILDCIGGYLAEMSIAKHLKIFPNLTVRKNGKGDKGDLKYKGYVLDIKSTHYKSGKLQVRKDAIIKTYVYILVIRHSFSRFEYIGCMSGKSMLADDMPEGLSKRGEFMQKEITQDKLLYLEELL